MNGPAFDLAPSGPRPWPSFHARIDIVGPVTNPVLTTDEGSIRYNGTIPTGQYVALNASPPSAFYGLTGAGILPDCTYTPKWGYLYSLLNTVRVTGAGITAGTSWEVTWRPVLP